MSADINLESWCDSLFRPVSKLTLNALPVKTPWVRTMKCLIPADELDIALGLPVSNSLLFCGPSGTGKQTLALATAASLAPSGYQLVRITGADFDTQLRAKFQTLFQRISPENPMVIVAEELDSCTDLQNLGMCLGQMAYVCKIQSLPVILIVIHEDEEELPQELRRNLSVCRFTLPDKDERIAFFESPIARDIPLQNGLSARDLALESDGLQFRQLIQSLRFMKLRVKEKALDKYKKHYDQAAFAIKSREITVNLQDFRDIVHRLKVPAKEAAAPVQVVSYMPAPAAAAVPLAQDAASKPDSHAEKLAKAQNANDFFDALFDGI
ncbi:MAG: AAA family ATPase [Oscillospiraceae bacterium]|nr:AAA family ATPase [Oscillospiraceae bacterium]